MAVIVCLGRDPESFVELPGGPSLAVGPFAAGRRLVETRLEWELGTEKHHSTWSWNEIDALQAGWVKYLVVVEHTRVQASRRFDEAYQSQNLYP